MNKTEIAERQTSLSDKRIVNSRYARYVLVVLMLVYLFNFIDRQILSILAEEIKADLGLSDGDIGFLYGTAFCRILCCFRYPASQTGGYMETAEIDIYRSVFLESDDSIVGVLLKVLCH